MVLLLLLALPPLALVTELSSLRKDGPVPTTGVAKLSGLGSVLLSREPKFHSG